MKPGKPLRQFLLTLAAAGMSACLSAGPVPALEVQTISKEFMPVESETCNASATEHPDEAKTPAVSEEMNSEDILFEAQSQEFISQEVQDEILSQENIPDEIPSQETVSDEIPSSETVPDEVPSQDFSSEESLSAETVSDFPGKLRVPLRFNRLGRVPQFFPVGILRRRVLRQHHLFVKKFILLIAVVLRLLVILTE